MGATEKVEPVTMLTKHKLDRINSRDIVALDDIEHVLDNHAVEGWEVVSVCRSGFVDGVSYYLITLRKHVPTDPISKLKETRG